jgi:hypothetical protein
MRMMLGTQDVDSVTSQSENSVKTWCTVHTTAVEGPSTELVECCYEEDLAVQTARAALDFSWDLGNNTLEPDVEEEGNNGISVVVGLPRNKNSVRAALSLYSRVHLLTKRRINHCRLGCRTRMSTAARTCGVRAAVRRRCMLNVLASIAWTLAANLPIASVMVWQSISVRTVFASGR